MRRLNPVSSLWADAYARICILATTWCDKGIDASTLDELYAFSDSEIVTNLQLIANAKQEALFQQQFEQALHNLIAKYTKEFDRVGKRVRKYEDFTDEEMERFLSGSGARNKLTQQIRTQKARIDQKRRNVEEQIRSSSSQEEKKALIEELVYLVRQTVIGSNEHIRRMEEGI
ncbi:MAG: hypothetical protein EOP06_23465 [Proteobacteria bacterium]|nr:MAG: hypothetical protein EOP06_23465 [Pseudomonadota bacterium]